MGGPYALDFGAVLAMGEARGADLDLLATALPAVEVAILGAWASDGDDGGDLTDE